MIFVSKVFLTASKYDGTGLLIIVALWFLSNSFAFIRLMTNNVSCLMEKYFEVYENWIFSIEICLTRL